MVTRSQMKMIEDYARSLMGHEVAHDFKHADRVRRWAVKIAQQEAYSDIACVEAAALLHDIGLSSGDRKRHAEIGAAMADQFLREHALFTEAQITAIVDAIRYHNALEDRGILAAILRDADILDLLGAVGIMRAFTSKAHLEEYPPQLVKGETWNMNAADFTERFKSGVGMGTFIVDQINFQISCFDNINTATAKRLALPLVAYMRAFIEQLEAEITAND
jgi:uncharacterized protein